MIEFVNATSSYSVYENKRSRKPVVEFVPALHVQGVFFWLEVAGRRLGCIRQAEVVSQLRVHQGTGRIVKEVRPA